MSCHDRGNFFSTIVYMITSSFYLITDQITFYNFSLSKSPFNLELLNVIFNLDNKSLFIFFSQKVYRTNLQCLMNLILKYKTVIDVMFS